MIKIIITGGRKFAPKVSAPIQRRKMTEIERKKRKSKKVKTSQKSIFFKLMERDTPNSIAHDVNLSDDETEN